MREAVEEAIALDKTPLTRQERAQVTREIADDILGYGPLEPFLRDETVTEIMVNGPSTDLHRAPRQARRAPTRRFVDDQHLLRIIDKIISRIGRRIDEASPMVDARLPDGSRVNAIIPPLAVSGPTLTIRKFRQDPLTMEDLLRFGTLTPKCGAVPRGVRARQAQRPHLGRYRLRQDDDAERALGGDPDDERIITVEDAAELQLRQEHVITLETRPANIEGKGLVSIRDLVRNTLRMRPDRIIVGECRGPETVDMLQAMNTGHDGSMTTIHANTPRDALSRVETLVLTGGVELPLKAIREQIASAFDLVVQVSRLVDGTRRITHVTEVLRMESDVVTMQDIFSRQADRGRRRGVRLRQPAARPDARTGIKPQFLAKLGEQRRAPAAAVLPARASARTAARLRGRRPSAGPRHEARPRHAAGARVRRRPRGHPRRRGQRRRRGLAAIQIAQVDTSRYPLITATVIAPDSDKLGHAGLTLSENGKEQTITQSGGGSQAAIGARARRQPLDEGQAARRARVGRDVVHQQEAHATTSSASTRSATPRARCSRPTPTATCSAPRCARAARHGRGHGALRRDHRGEPRARDRADADARAGRPDRRRRHHEDDARRRPSRSPRAPA